MKFPFTRPDSAPPHATPPFTMAELPTPHIEFAMTLESSPYGARLARQLAVAQLTLWGVRQVPGLSGSVAIVTAELAANATLHATAPGDTFELRMSLLGDRIRIQVTDPSPHRPLPATATTPAPDTAPDTDAISGRGLLLVATCADRWGWTTTDSPPTKSVWADLTLTP
ncbi:ATP-binding protein [Yinghuangia sp. ASG 101]|uniref:ATP-binding protein n=1 Tax=Yinghuangia sp. ASG 101 TaxID=2896848 RepID=UPI001E3561DB|nr:ATP-binding protein [Yinghuangia sp. ASG 101]UGQ12801.1 ATP-binding protein [Yinghuangia sp. ASG 101]